MVGLAAATPAWIDDRRIIRRRFLLDRVSKVIASFRREGNKLVQQPGGSQ